MNESVRFEDKVVIITGAGGGLGRAHALLFAKQGAKVLVNDLGGSAQGEGANASAADRVVAEIREAGGIAEANHCLLYTSPSPRDQRGSRMPSSA